MSRARTELAEAPQHLAVANDDAVKIQDDAKQQAANLQETSQKNVPALLVQAEGQATTLRVEVEQELRETQSQLNDLRTRLRHMQDQVVQTEELALLQEAGIYEYRHPLADAVAYKAKLAELGTITTLRPLLRNAKPARLLLGEPLTPQRDDRTIT